MKMRRTGFPVHFFAVLFSCVFAAGAAGEDAEEVEALFASFHLIH